MTGLTSRPTFFIKLEKKKSLLYSPFLYCHPSALKFCIKISFGQDFMQTVKDELEMKQ